MRRRRISGALLAFTACAHAPPAPTPATTIDSAITRAHDVMATRTQRSGWPDAAVGVVLDGRLVYAEGFGVRDPASKDPVTAHTLFRIASLTKLFTGMAILQLRDQGKLDLDDPVAKYVPEIDMVVYPTSEHPPIRIRHLVTHTSGLPRDGNRETAISEANLLKGLRALPLEFTPGSDQSYSNLGMAIAGLIVARVSRMPYREYMTRFVLEPLDMKESVWEASAATQPVAMGMTWDSELKGYRPIAQEQVEGAMEPAGGLYSNISDLAKFAALEMAAWPARSTDERPPISRASLRESQLTAGPSVPVGGGPGVNWFVRGNPSFGQLNLHAGRLEGYRSEIMLLPRRHVAVVVLSCDSSGDTAIDQTAFQVLEAFAPLTSEPPKPVGPQLKAAVERLVAWLAFADPASAPTVFSPDTLKHDVHLFGDTEAARARYGTDCKITEFLEGGMSRGKVRLRCSRGEWTFTVSIQPAPPYLIQGWRWE